MKNDLINRQMAIDELEHKKDKNAKGDISGFYNKIIQNDIDALMQLPSVQSESKKGKWIEAYDPFNRISGRCSVCGWEAHLYEDDVVGMNYCPNCGADMRGEQDDESRSKSNAQTDTRARGMGTTDKSSGI